MLTARRILFSLEAWVAILGQAGGQPLLKLENDKLAVEISPQDGSLRVVRNKLTGDEHHTSDTAFIIYTDRGELRADTSRLVKREQHADRLDLQYERQPFSIRVRYELRPDRHFMEKTVSLENRGAEPALIQEVIADRLRFTPKFQEAYEHDDGTDWKCPINLFLRTEKGGLLLGVENPYFEMSAPGAWNATRVELRYAPRWLLPPRQTFESEPAFLGVYRNEGIYFFKEMQQFNYMRQQQIILDWGEVWAMQDFLCAIQPAYELPYPGYYLRGNCVGFFTDLGVPDPADPKPFGQAPDYWSAHNHCRFEAPLVPAAKYFADLMAQQGHVRSIDWGTIWLGHAGWLRESPDRYLETLDESWNIEPNPYWKEAVDYAREKGLGAGAMDEGGARDYLKNEDRWKIVGRDDKPVAGEVQYVGLMGRNCWANPAFARWWAGIVGKTIDRFQMPIWGTDGGQVWWIPFDPPLECYAKDHGHPVGECGYYAWRNVMWASGELRRLHPRCVLRNAGGMHRGYPWVLRDWVEFHPYLDPVPMGEGGGLEDNIRFQTWHSHNLRFIPAYKFGGGARTDDPDGMAYGMFSELTRGAMGTASLVPPKRVTDPEERKKHLAFYRKWTDWADRNIEYLRVRRDILGEPRLTGLDGCAHVIRDRGFIFVFNPSRGARAASIPLNQWIELSEGTRFAVKEIYPAEALSYGAYSRGESVIVPVKSHGVLALEIGPATGNEQAAHPEVSTGIPIEKAFLNRAEMEERLKKR